MLPIFLALSLAVALLHPWTTERWCMTAGAPVQPWEIHQDLPYGTMADDEMRKLNIGCLQDDGVIFVWVTGAEGFVLGHTIVLGALCLPRLVLPPLR
jgi:N6-adenosine-specific RNA methylase IME4